MTAKTSVYEADKNEVQEVQEEKQNEEFPKELNMIIEMFSSNLHTTIPNIASYPQNAVNELHLSPEKTQELTQELHSRIKEELKRKIEKHIEQWEIDNFGNTTTNKEKEILKRMRTFLNETNSIGFIAKFIGDSQNITQEITNIFDDLYSHLSELLKTEDEANKAEIINNTVAILYNNKFPKTPEILFQRGVTAILIVNDKTISLIFRKCPIDENHPEIQKMLNPKKPLHTRLLGYFSKKTQPEKTTEINPEELGELITKLIQQTKK